MFFSRRIRGQREGELIGWPRTIGAWCNSELKMKALNRAMKYQKIPSGGGVLPRKYTYQDLFYRKYVKGPKKGQIYGWPFLRGPRCQSELKLAALRNAMKYKELKPSFLAAPHHAGLRKIA